MTTTAGTTTQVEPIIRARKLVKHFPIRSKGFFRRRIGDIHAVCSVSLDLMPGRTMGLVGESGCGKSTTARLLLNLIPADSGSVVYDGKDLTQMPRRDIQPIRRQLQIVFQDPYASLDPRMTVMNLIAEPLQIHGLWDRNGKDRVRELLKIVGLNPEHGNRYPHEFSGGQRQRIGVARALALNPKFIVLDEPVSALDVSIRAGVLNLLENLQDELDLAYMFVSHDLSVVRHIAHDLSVMYLGRIVEAGTSTQVFDRPSHPYTQALISAIPLPDPRKERTRRRIILEGDVPSPANPPSGCRFRTRCPKFANELTEQERQRCIEEIPRLIDREGNGHRTACHYAEAVAMLETQAS
ncbi:MAG TPA: oligopeptide/dipeptide ABC transporter ATP-binding protein [Acidimicrobiia bacterium]